jgi:hypothetical protein
VHKSSIRSGGAVGVLPASRLKSYFTGDSGGAGGGTRIAVESVSCPRSIFCDCDHRFTFRGHDYFVNQGEAFVRHDECFQVHVFGSSLHLSGYRSLTFQSLENLRWIYFEDRRLGDGLCTAGACPHDGPLRGIIRSIAQGTKGRVGTKEGCVVDDLSLRRGIANSKLQPAPSCAGVVLLLRGTSFGRRCRYARCRCHQCSVQKGKILEARVGTEPTHKGFADLSLTTWVPRPDQRWRQKAQNGARANGDRNLERETGFEPATSTLARSHSTTELLPLVLSFYSTCTLLPIHCTRTTLPLGSSGTIPNSAMYCS